MRTISALILLLTVNTLHIQPDLKARLDSFISNQPANQPGFALSITKNGKILYRNAAGLADVDTKTPIDSLTNFRMASVSKQFTAMGIMLLEKQGLLHFDDPIGRWLPELPAGVGRHVLIRHLLTHSSGILDYETLIPPAQTTQLLDADVLHLLSTHDSTYFIPGSRFRYSNSGFCLLALIVQRASKTSFPEFIRAHIFQPLHMDSSAEYIADSHTPNRAMGYPADQSITSATKGDGGVYTSLSDYDKWINALELNTLLPLAPTLQRLRFPITNLTNRYYAAGWFIDLNTPNLLFHSGSTCGFANFVIQLPQNNISIVYFSNLAGNSAPFKTILQILKDSGYPDLTSVFALHEQTR
ncbi:MAG TPA: serine hydrolase domain-containing protein [Puia sp.]|nr:serine hydrolase domain-containing protein [Puia sp.]